MTFIPGIYRHFKGNLYAAVCTAKDSEDPSRTLVIYRALYGEGEVWVRPLSMWQEQVCRDEITQPRFTFVRPFKEGENPFSFDFNGTNV